MLEPLMAYLHYVAIIMTGACLTAEMAVCRPGMRPEQVRLLSRLDGLFFAAAVGALATGLLRLIFFAKGLAFYVHNPFFWVKMALYVTIALMSIAPTVQFIKWNRALASGGAPPDAGAIAHARRWVHIELGLLALMPLMAVLMARGMAEVHR